MYKPLTNECLPPSYPPAVPFGNNINLGFRTDQFSQMAYPGNAGPQPPPPGMNYQPTAPSLDDMQTIKGYENINFEGVTLLPPVAPDWRKEEPQRQDISGIPSLTEEEIRDALLQYVSENCCYGKGAARNLQIREIRMTSAFHYKLETFTEKRESAWCFEPYHGQAVDGPMNGPAPGPWDVVLYPPHNFVDAKTKMEVPHTAFVKPCHVCVGNGRVRCSSCEGIGQINCTWCHGTGRRFDEQCSSCLSTGRSRCLTCDATGQVKCRTCDGRGNVKSFVQLTAIWTNHYDDYISDTSKLPKEKVRDVAGSVVFEEENPRVWPISHSTDMVVNQASNNLVQKHNNQFPQERILRQRHCLRIIPIAESNYQWKNKIGEFYVYGFEKKVYFENYPQSCCWCCVIM